MRMLVADPDPETRRVIRGAVDHPEDIWLEVPDGETALQVCTGAQPPDAAWIGRIENPGAAELCRCLQDRPDASAVVRVVLLESYSAGAEAALLAGGADAVLPLPPDVDSLRAWTAAIRRRVAHLETQREAVRTLEALAADRFRQLQHADRLASLGTLAAGVAHEIHNPAGYISLNGQLLRKLWGEIAPLLREARQRGEGDARQIDLALAVGERLLDGIVNGAHRISDIARDMKHFAREDDSARDPQDVGECVRTALELCRKALGRAAYVKTAVPDALPKIRMRRREVEQVLVNLIVNAADAIEGRPGGRIFVGVSAADHRVRIVVEDTGPGIPPGDRERIWEPFFTTKSEDRGAGLGLSVSRGIVEEHGGQIVVESPPRGGTRFVVELPVDPRDEAVSA